MAVTRTEIGAFPSSSRSEKIIDTVSHAGERIVKANRSIRAQELSVVGRANVDMVPALARKK